MEEKYISENGRYIVKIWHIEGKLWGSEIRFQNDVFVSKSTHVGKDAAILQTEAFCGKLIKQ